jgi:nitrous oxide reductase accessory protein NosL
MYKLLIAMLAMLMLSGIALAQGDEEATRCDYCGMFWDTSSTRLEIDMIVDGKSMISHFESVGCLINSMQELKESGAKEMKISSARILDYSSFGSDREVMTDAMKAWYLVDTKKLKGSMAPFIAAFGSKEVAAEMQKSLGGELLDHDAMHAWFSKDDKADPHAGHDHGAGGASDNPSAEVYICPCSGDCCLDIVSDKPGECPKCGMQLVLKTDK